MSQHVSPQVDVGGLSLRGLGAFSSILATLSTDGRRAYRNATNGKAWDLLPNQWPQSC